MASKEYNGHPSRRLWNLALWLANDEGMYRVALECIRTNRTRKDAARDFVQVANDCGTTHTPDGYRFTVSGVQYAMRGLR